MLCLHKGCTVVGIEIRLSSYVVKNIGTSVVPIVCVFIFVLLVLWASLVCFSCFHEMSPEK